VEVYGTAGPIDSYDFHGGTDPQIIRDFLTAAGLSLVEIAAGEPRLYARYVAHLEAEIGEGREVTLYPGVASLIEALAETERCVLGLLTGNIEAGARIKLRPTGLWACFRIGAFGSDDADRRQLPGIATRRAEAAVGHAFRGREVVVIGDTPRDVGSARAFGATALAVATGRHSPDELLACAPDHVFPDLGDTPRVLAAIFDGTSG
jgi:phosphoglycolate phosphatase-like HAD superfamily hydrolase